MIPSFFQDWVANQGNRRSQFVLLLFRIANYVHRLPRATRWIGLPYLAFYELVVIWILGIELSYKASVGPALRLFHGVATVIHQSVIIGRNCTLRHSTTIGMRKEGEPVPTLGDHVDIGAHSVIMGPIEIGNHVTIGAGSILLQNVPDCSTVAGNPARILHISENEKMHQQ